MFCSLLRGAAAGGSLRSDGDIVASRVLVLLSPDWLDEGFGIRLLASVGFRLSEISLEIYLTALAYMGSIHPHLSAWNTGLGF